MGFNVIKIKLLISQLVLLIVTVTLVACGKTKTGTEQTVTLRFWHSFVSSTVPALNALIAKFEQENPGLKIKAQYVPSGDALMQKLVTAVQSNTAPDISWIHSDFLEDLVESNAIFKMSRFTKGQNGLTQADFDDIYTPLIQYASWRDTLYSLPLEATNIALLYNRDLFREAGLDPNQPPRTWAELADFAHRLTVDKDGDGKIDQTGLFIPVFPASGPLGGWMVWQWYPFLWQAGGNLINDDQTRVLYNEDPAVEALTLWSELYRDLNLVTFSTDYDVAFASRRLAMAFDGPWNLPRFKVLLKDVDWGFAPLPAGPVREATIVGGEYLTIFKQSANPDAAWTFLKWIIQPENQAFWAMESGYLLVRKSANEVPAFKAYLKENPNFKAFVDQMATSYAQRPIDYHAMRITTHLAEALEKATVGGVDPRVALDASAAKSNELLKSVER